MDDDRSCLQCGGPMEHRRSDAIFCRQRCRRRYYRRRQSSNYIDPTAWPFPDPADERFREQFESERVRSQPLTDQERELLAHQRRNPGVLLPELQQMLLDRATEQQRREAAERSQHQPIKVEDRLDPSSHGSLARRAATTERAIGRKTPTCPSCGRGRADPGHPPSTTNRSASMLQSAGTSSRGADECSSIRTHCPPSDTNTWYKPGTCQATGLQMGMALQGSGIDLRQFDACPSIRDDSSTERPVKPNALRSASPRNGVAYVTPESPEC